MSPNSDKINNEKAILQAANQQLKALNLQLAATEQQLRAANQQLTAGQQQLKAANQQLKAEQQELRQRKTELRRQHTILRTLIDNIPDPIYVKDADSRFIAVNIALAKHVAAKGPNDVIGKTDYDLYPQDLAAKFYLDEKNIFKTGQPLINIEERNIDAKGNPLWFSTSKIPLKDDQDNFIGIVGISRNITERKQFEQELVVTNQKLVANKQQLKAANQQLIASEQQLKAANQQLKADEQQLKAANQQLKASHQQILAANQQLKAANQHLTANEQQLRALNQQLSAAEKELIALAKFPTENPNAVLRVTKEGYIIFANKTADLLLDAWQTKTKQNLPVHWAKIIKEVLLAGSAKYLEFEHKGQTFALTFAPILDSGYVNIYGHDISERKRMEILLQESHDKLEQRVRERTLELETANEKLRQEARERIKAEEKILEHQEKLRYMTSQLSLSEEHQRKQIAETLHDDAIQTLVFLKMKINDLQGLDCAKTCSKNVPKILDQLNQQTSDLIQRLRTLTFDLGSPILYDLGLAAAIKDWLTREIGEKHGIETSFKNEHISKPLDNDLRALLYRAVRELLANVVKHAKAKKINVSKTRNTDNIIITVEDDGVGFNHSNEFKYDIATGGFGLFTINERLNQYNGTLKIDSKPGYGTKVTLTAPLKFRD